MRTCKRWCSAVARALRVTWRARRRRKGVRPRQTLAEDGVVLAAVEAAALAVFATAVATVAVVVGGVAMAVRRVARSALGNRDVIQLERLQANSTRRKKRSLRCVCLR